MSKKEKDLIKVNGIITKALPDNMYVVRLIVEEIEGNSSVAENSMSKQQHGHEIIAYSRGNIKKNKIRLIVGDKVSLEISPYDLTKGRISMRLTNNKRIENSQP